MIGWTLACLYWTFAGYIGTDFSWTLASIHLTLDLLIYILLSHSYRNFSRKNKWHLLNARSLVGRLVPAILLLGTMFMLLTISKNWLVRSAFEQGFNSSWMDSVNNFGITTFVTGVRLMSIWVLAYYGYHFAQREMNAIKESNRLAIIAREASFTNLTTQLNPHFFFNSLNSIKALVIENPEAARRSIDLLSDLLRTSLYERNTEMITVKEEMELIHDYLELEKMRFEKRLTSIIEVNEEINTNLILPLSIQVLVENALKHGIAPRKDGGIVHILIEKKEGLMEVLVKNPGVLITAATTGLGLKNLQERLALIYNGKASFNILQHDTETVMATLKIPLT